jgi:hypothetical protein
MNRFDSISRIAEVEFADIVIQTNTMGAKLRILLRDASYVDVWISRKLNARFGFHWERRHLDERIYRYDNFPDTDWSSVSTFPFHFHVGDHENVEAAPFAQELETGFREFMVFVQKSIQKSENAFR